jgi:hypothetical protein
MLTKGKQSLLFAQSIREKCIQLSKSLTIAQLNQIPAHYNNNIAWHIGHMGVSTEILCYIKTQIEPDKLIFYREHYQNGTRPTYFINEAEIAYWQEQLLNSITAIEKDYVLGTLNNITPFSTHTFGVMCKDIDTVLECCSLHDAVHWGHIQSLKKLV